MNENETLFHSIKCANCNEKSSNEMRKVTGKNSENVHNNAICCMLNVRNQGSL